MGNIEQQTKIEFRKSVCPECGDDQGTSMGCTLCERQNPELKRQREALEESNKSRPRRR